MENVKSFESLIEPEGQYNSRIIPHKPTYKWNNDNFGPFTLPKEGATVNLDTSNICLYKRVIINYENTVFSSMK